MATDPTKLMTGLITSVSDAQIAGSPRACADCGEPADGERCAECHQTYVFNTTECEDCGKRFDPAAMVKHPEHGEKVCRPCWRAWANTQAPDADF